jgi:hypothetical protein
MVKVKFRRWARSLVAMDAETRGSVDGSKHAHGAGDQPLTKHGTHQANAEQDVSCVMVWAHKKEEGESASMVNVDMNAWFPDRDLLKVEFQNIADAVQQHWPFFKVYRKIMEESKGYFSVAVIHADRGTNTQVDLIINGNVRKSLRGWMNAVLNPMGQSIKNVEKETVCTRIESPLLAGMVNDPKVHGQMRIHFYPVNGGYMMMHTDSAGQDSWTFFKCSYMETGVGLQPQADLPFHLDFTGSEGESMTVVYDD